MGTFLSLLFLGFIFAGAHAADLRIKARVTHFATTSKATTRRRDK